MRCTSFTFIGVLASCALAQDAAPLEVRLLSSATVIGQQVIVGRAHCVGATWLLTERLELTRVSADSHATSTSLLRGLREGEKPWGLACLSRSQLWTLVTHDALAQITADGQIIGRVRLDRPRLGIYSAGERLLLQQPPAGIGGPLLSAGLPASVRAFTEWPAPISQYARSPDEQLRANLVSCGIGVSGYVPCWLTNQTRLVIGDGTHAHTTERELRFLRAAGFDEAAPIWDVALAGASRVWVLASARPGPEGRRVGGRLTRSNRRAEDEGNIDLNPPARLILWATDERCVLLSATGQLLEVLAP